jgi:hypothetical protein
VWFPLAGLKKAVGIALCHIVAKNFSETGQNVHGRWADALGQSLQNEHGLRLTTERKRRICMLVRKLLETRNRPERTPDQMWIAVTEFKVKKVGVFMNLKCERRAEIDTPQNACIAPGKEGAKMKLFGTNLAWNEAREASRATFDGASVWMF